MTATVCLWFWEGSRMLSEQPAGRTTNSNTGLPALSPRWPSARMNDCRDDANDVEGALVWRGRRPRDVACRVAQSGVPATSPATAVQRPASAAEPTAEDLNAQAERLRNRTAAVTLRPSTRNPFRFSSSKSSARIAASRERAFSRRHRARRFQLAPPPPPLNLSGVAQKARQRARRSSPATGRFIWSAKATRSPAATPSSRSIRKRSFSATTPAPNSGVFELTNTIRASDFEAPGFRPGASHSSPPAREPKHSRHKFPFSRRCTASRSSSAARLSASSYFMDAAYSAADFGVLNASSRET